MVKSTTTGTVTSSGRDGTAAAMTQNKQTAEEHSTPEQQPPGRLDHPAWCVVWTVQPASTLKYSEDTDVTAVTVGCTAGGMRFCDFCSCDPLTVILTLCYRNLT